MIIILLTLIIVLFIITTQSLYDEPPDWADYILPDRLVDVEHLSYEQKRHLYTSIPDDYQLTDIGYNELFHSIEE